MIVPVRVQYILWKKKYKDIIKVISYLHKDTLTFKVFYHFTKLFDFFINEPF